MWNAQLLENLQDADVRRAARTAARERKPDFRARPRGGRWADRILLRESDAEGKEEPAGHNDTRYT